MQIAFHYVARVRTWFVFITGLVIVSMNCFTCKFEEFCILVVVVMVTRPCTGLCVCIVFIL